jgi:uncharacterized membrane protein
MAFAITLHLLAALIWVGGMFFAYMVLRPAAGAVLGPEERLRLWARALGGFFRWVWVAVVLLLASGYWMIFVEYGGMGGIDLNVHLMQGLGILMMMIFAHLFFAPYGRLRRAVDREDWTEASPQLEQIRRYVGVNLALGLVTIVVASGGSYL